MNDELSFGSKIDLWLLILLLSAVVTCVWVAGAQWDSIRGGNWLLSIPLALGIGLPLWILASLRYFLSDDALRIRCGPFRMRVPIAEISSITPTRNPLSSPALSLDRLRIEYGAGRAIMISPEPREEFLRQLEYRRRQLAG
jgi:hypothetical protein